MAMTGITPANRGYENCTIGALSYYCAKTGHLELLVYRNSSTGHGLQSYRPSKKNISYESSNELSFVVLSFTKRMTSYALAKSESKSNRGFVFFFSMMFASCFKNEPLFLIHVPDY